MKNCPSNLCQKSKKIYEKYVSILECYISSILLLAIRIWVGLVFVKSGLTKISNFDQTINLFTYEYNLPFLDPKISAILATITELGCGGAVIIGLAARLTSLPLIVMTIVIQTLVFQNPEHFYWGFLLATIAVFGAGKLSADQLAKTLCNKCNKSKK
jgi:putative oxidoreductase